MNILTLLRHGIALCVLSLLSLSSFAQNDCEPPTGFVAHFVYPFGDQLYAYWDSDTVSSSWQVTYGAPGFDPYLSEGDSVFQTNFWAIVNGPILPAETHFDVYMQSICALGDTSSWVGPIDIYRDLPPDSCGYDMEHACELELEPDEGLYYNLPAEYQGSVSEVFDPSCSTHDQAAWYTFLAPDNGEVVINAYRSSTYISVFDENAQEVFCSITPDTCISFEATLDSLHFDSIPLSLIPGNQYYVLMATALFCDDIGGFFYWDTGLQVNSNSPEVLCDEPTEFEVNFNYPFGTMGGAFWQSVSSTNELYYGPPGFDPYNAEGDSLIQAGSSAWLFNDFPIDVHYDGYVRAVCDSLTSDWVGPVDIYRPLPPDSCGWDMEHACEIYPQEECTEHFIIPEAYQDYTIHSSECEGFDRAGWYTFTAPATGEVELDFINSTMYYTVYDSGGEELICAVDTCIPGYAPEDIENVALSLTPGEQYYVATAVGLFCDGLGLPAWYISGLCITAEIEAISLEIESDTIMALCSEGMPFIEPTITSDCGVLDLSYTDSLTQESCPIIWSRTYVVTDNCGNSATTTQWLALTEDLGLPICLEDVTITAVAGSAPNPWVEEDYPFYSSCGFDIEISISPPSGAELPIGVHEIIGTGVDECGNIETCTSFVTVEFQPEPLIVSHSMDTLYSCEEEIPLFELEISGGCPPYNVVGEEEYFAINECETVFQAAFTVQDACDQEVYIEHEYLITDFTGPTVICPETDTVFTSSGFNIQPYNYTDAIITDNCGEVYDFLVEPAYQDLLSAGEYTLFIGAIDACGNEGSCTTQLIVADPVGLEEPLFDEVIIYQQESFLWITYPEQLRGSQCQLYDLSGKKLAETTLKDEPESIDLSGLSAGNYLLTFSVGVQVVHSRRVRVE